MALRRNSGEGKEKWERPRGEKRTMKEEEDKGKEEQKGERENRRGR